MLYMNEIVCMELLFNFLSQAFYAEFWRDTLLTYIAEYKKNVLCVFFRKTPRLINTRPVHCKWSND